MAEAESIVCPARGCVPRTCIRTIWNVERRRTYNSQVRVWRSQFRDNVHTADRDVYTPAPFDIITSTTYRPTAAYGRTFDSSYAGGLEGERLSDSKCSRPVTTKTDRSIFTRRRRGRRNRFKQFNLERFRRCCRQINEL